MEKYEIVALVFITICLFSYVVVALIIYFDMRGKGKTELMNMRCSAPKPKSRK